MSLIRGSYTRDPLPSDVILTEVNETYSRDTVTFLSTGVVQDLKIGTVVAQITAAGAAKNKWVVFNQDGTDGSQTPLGVLIAPLSVPAAGDASGVILARGCKVRSDALIWPGDATAGEIGAAVNDLRAADIHAMPDARYA